MKLDPERQVAVYLAAQSREPPDTSYCSRLAESSGAAAVPVIIKALEVEKEDFARLDLLRGLECITQARGCVDDPRSLAIAKQAAAEIKTKDWQQSVRTIAATIGCDAASTKSDSRTAITPPVP